jgi:hypothetical protein
VVDTDSLRVVKRVRGAHMTFATSVAFSPDELFIISGSSDASAVLTRIGRPLAAGGGAGLLALLLAAVALLLAALAGLLRHAAATRPEELRQLLAPAAPVLQHAASLQWLPLPLRDWLAQLT